jgi:hypothetical protein
MRWPLTRLVVSWSCSADSIKRTNASPRLGSGTVLRGRSAPSMVHLRDTSTRWPTTWAAVSRSSLVGTLVEVVQKRGNGMEPHGHNVWSVVRLEEPTTRWHMTRPVVSSFSLVGAPSTRAGLRLGSGMEPRGLVEMWLDRRRGTTTRCRTTRLVASRFFSAVPSVESQTLKRGNGMEPCGLSDKSVDPQPAVVTAWPLTWNGASACWFVAVRSAQKRGIGMGLRGHRLALAALYGAARIDLHSTQHDAS